MSKATYHKLHNAKQPKQHIINCCATESHVTTATYITPEYQHRLILEDSEVYNKIIDESNNTKQSLFKKLINIIRRYH